MNFYSNREIQLSINILSKLERVNSILMVAFFYLGIEELRDKYSLKVLYFDEFYELACYELLDHRIMSLLRAKSCSIDELIREIGEAEDWVHGRVERIIRNNVIIDEDEKLKLMRN